MTEAKYTVEKGATRKELRGEVRPDDSRARAAARAAEIKANRGDIDLDSVDKFYISPDIVPEGWTYEWKRHHLFGKEDPAYQVTLARAGWQAVPAIRHPEYMPVGGNYSAIERDGMILMERPEVLTKEYKDIELRRAIGQVRAKEAQLGSTPDGTMTREHAKVRPNVKKSFEPVPIPED